MRPAISDASTQLESLFQSELDVVFGYLVSRCGSRALAEDLTAETFLAAGRRIESGGDDQPKHAEQHGETDDHDVKPEHLFGIHICRTEMEIHPAENRQNRHQQQLRKYHEYGFSLASVGVAGMDY